MKAILVICALLLLTGCGTIGANIQADLQKIQGIAVPDLQAALADASAHGDQAAVNCYQTLLLIIQSNTITVPTIKGVASGFQAARDMISNNGAQAIAKQINLGCAALFVDANFAAAKLAATMGVGIPVIGALP